MSREQLLELASELDRLLSAGARSAVGSDNLRRRARIVEELAVKVPALVPLKEAIDKVLTAPTKEAPTALLELLTRARQMRAGLGDPTTPGDLGSLHEREGCQTPLSTKRAHELYDTFTGGGSGKHSELEEAIKQKEIFDLRLQRVLVDALDDKDAGFAETVSKEALPKLGHAVLNDLVAALNIPEGESGDTRRLQSICLIDEKVGAELARKALKEGSLKMVVQALESLPEVVTPTEAEAAGLEFSKDKRATIRAAAIRALRTSKKDEALELVLERARDKSSEVSNAALEVLGQMKHPKTTDRMMESIRSLLDNLPVVPKLKREKKKKPVKGAKKAAKGKAAKTTAKGPTAEEIAALNRKRWEELGRANNLLRALAERKDIQRADVGEFILPLVDSKEHQINDAARLVLVGVGPSIPDVVPKLKKVIESSSGWRLNPLVEMMKKLSPKDRSELLPSLNKATAKGYVPYGVVQSLVEMLRDHAKTDEAPFLEFLKNQAASREQWRWNIAITELRELDTTKSAPMLSSAVDSYLKFVGSYYAPSFDELAKLIKRDDPTGKVSVPRIAKALGATKKTDAKITLLRFLEDLGTLAASAKPACEKLSKDRKKETKEQLAKTLKAIAP
jgi:hypothetical protein